jgi:hypothetical protein
MVITTYKRFFSLSPLSPLFFVDTPKKTPVTRHETRPNQKDVYIGQTLIGS